LHYFKPTYTNQDNQQNNLNASACFTEALEAAALFAWLISHQLAVLFSQNKPATSNQPTVLFSQNKPTPAISHQPTELAEHMKSNMIVY
jgi:hypothetical protein